MKKYLFLLAILALLGLNSCGEPIVRAALYQSPYILYGSQACWGFYPQPSPYYSKPLDYQRAYIQGQIEYRTTLYNGGQPQRTIIVRKPLRRLR